jgi:hypothetical protein
MNKDQLFGYIVGGAVYLFIGFVGSLWAEDQRYVRGAGEGFAAMLFWPIFFVLGTLRGLFTLTIKVCKGFERF